MKKMRVQKKIDGFYSVKEVANILNVSTRTVHKYLHESGLKYKKIGNRNFVSDNDLSNWILSQSGMDLKSWIEETAKSEISVM